MHVIIPSGEGLRSFSTRTAFSSLDGYASRVKVRLYTTLYGSSKMIDVDNLFIERPATDDFNNVVHCKLLSTGADVTVRDRATGDYLPTYVNMHTFQPPADRPDYPEYEYENHGKEWREYECSTTNSGSYTWTLGCTYTVRIPYKVSDPASSTQAARWDYYYLSGYVRVDWNAFRDPQIQYTYSKTDYLASYMMIGAHSSGITSLGRYNYKDYGALAKLAWAMRDEAREAANRLVADAAMTEYASFKKGYFNVAPTYVGADLEYDVPHAGRERFILNEPAIYGEGIDPMIVEGKDFKSYWRNTLINQSYLDALDNVPRLNDNSISNIIELVGFVKSLLIDHRIEIPKSLSSAWLSYRYAYTTTKLDAEEAIEFVHRHMGDCDWNNWVSCYGAASHDFESGEHVTCRCGLRIRPKELSTFADIWRSLYTYGLQPNFYVLWDMIPYSFIVDWFIPVGDLAHVLDAEQQYSGTNYDIRDVCFSLSYDSPDLETHQYTRWYQGSPPVLNGFYFLEQEPLTQKILGFRVFDALALFIG